MALRTKDIHKKQKGNCSPNHELIFYVACLLPTAGSAQPKTASVPLDAGMNQVFFSTPDPAMQQLFDVAEKKAADNTKAFSPNWSVLVEGAEYPYVWVETQPMADAFVRENLLNPAAFWTPMPMPSTAANDPFFRNVANNNWSGQPQGLTYQRAIGALENYGHRAEVTLIGARLLRNISQTGRFTQQFDPFTAVQNGSDGYGYGPTILATLEYYARLFGVYPQNDTLHFSGMAARQPYTYTQKLKDNHYKLVQDKGRLTGYLNGRELFSSTAGIDVMTSPAGKILGLAGIDTVARNVQLKTGGKSYQATIEPNGYYRLTASGIQLLRKVPFDFPYRKRKPLKISNL